MKIILFLNFMISFNCLAEENSLNVGMKMSTDIVVSKPNEVEDFKKYKNEILKLDSHECIQNKLKSQTDKNLLLQMLSTVPGICMCENKSIVSSAISEIKKIANKYPHWVGKNITFNNDTIYVSSLVTYKPTEAALLKCK